MSYTLQQIKSSIDRNGYKWCKIYDSHKSMVLFINERLYVGITPEKMYEEIKNFVQDSPGIYTIEFKKNSQYPSTSINRFKDVNCIPITIPVQQVQEHRNTTDIDSMKQQLLKEVRQTIEAEQEEQRKKEEAEAYNKRITEINTMAGQFKAFLAAVMGNPQPLHGQLQGNMTHTQQPNQQGQQQNQQQNPMPYVPGTYFKGTLSPEQIYRANVCLEKLISKMTLEDLELFTAKIFENPQLVQTLKSFM